MPIFKKIKAVIEKPQKIILYFGGTALFNWLPDELYIRMMYRCRTGKSLNLKNPATFNEKLQWLKLYDRNPAYSQLVDKYEVRNYITETIGDEYLIPLLGVYDNFEEIEFNKLPEKFVLKCTHDSGSIIICTNKSELDIEETRRKMNKRLKKKYYLHSREWPYKNLKPRIVCEEFISEDGAAPPDFKVMCFNGKAKLVVVHLNRYSKDRRTAFYDINWEKTNIAAMGIPNPETDVPRPKNLEQMISMSEMLAKDKYYVRVDWYVVGSKLYFGEITFFDASGFLNFSSCDDDLMISNWIQLLVD